jgi:LPXTG-motif cell wall-anchored protein
MSFLGIILVFFGILVIAAPLGWIGLKRKQRQSKT